MVTKKILQKYLNHIVLNKVKKYGIQELEVHGILLPKLGNSDRNYGQIFIDVEPLLKSFSNYESIKKKLDEEIDNFFTYVNELSWNWDIYYDKRPLHHLDESLPFKEKVNKNERIRTFLESTDDSEFKWHQDNEDRLVYPTHKTDWMVQLDNQLPIKLDPNKKILIPEGVWHRVIKGTGDLEVKVKFI